MDRRLPQDRLASQFSSVAQLWRHRITSTPDTEAYSWRGDHGVETLNWGRAGERVDHIAGGLLAQGLLTGERCAVFAETSVEWILADLAILCAGAATTTVYPACADSEVLFILADSKSRFVFAGDAALAARVVAFRDQLPHLERVYVLRGDGSDDGFVEPLWRLEVKGAEALRGNPTLVSSLSQALSGDSLATLMYTSGTTGRPKGVELSQSAWVYEGEAIDALGILSPVDRQVLFLPLAHVFAKVLQVVAIRLGIPSFVHGDAQSVLQILPEAEPTWMAAVPRVFERAYDRIINEAKKAGPARWKTFQWAIDIGRQVSSLRREGKRPGVALRVQYELADRLVLQRIRAAFGSRLRFFISGGAPLPIDIARFFDAAGVLILEGYGLTETSAASFINRPDDVRFGTVGKPVPGCEVRIADDGEILLKSPGLMRRYHGLPDETDEVLVDGWLKTGDVGFLHPSGHLQITDRKKDLIVTAGGKNIAPSQFEGLLTARCPYVAHVIMHGDRRAFCTALVTLDAAAATRWARENQVPFADLADLAYRPELRRLVQEAITQVNRELAPFETVKKFVILPEDFTVANGLMTPSLKVKRRAVEEQYRAVLDGMYGAPTPAPWPRRR